MARIAWGPAKSATTGTTPVAAIDPVSAIADVTQRHAMWLHVDAAYGGFFLLTERGRGLMRGIERANSITLDPHKSLFMPYGTPGNDVQPQAMVQYLVNLLDDGMDPHPPRAVGTRHGVHAEHAEQKVRPGNPRGVASGGQLHPGGQQAGPLLRRVRVARDDIGPPSRRGRETPW